MSGYRIFSRTEKSRDYNHKLNEDKYMYTECMFMNDVKLKILSIADGMGGLECGDKASYCAIEAFHQAVYKELLNEYMSHSADNFSMTYYADRMEKMVRRGFTAANQNVCEKADPFVETGTTLSVVVILGDYAVAANLGDSPIYFYRAKNEEFKMVSQLHTKAEMDVKEGKYARYSVEYYQNDNVVSRSMGEKDNLSEDEVYVQILGYLQPGDFFLLGSDGAFGRMDEEQVFQVITEEKDKNALKRLFEEARKDKDDDQTGIFLKLYEEGAGYAEK